MVTFSSLFKELTKNKFRLVRRLVCLQLVVGILLGFWALLHSAFEGESKSYFMIAFISITPLFDIVYLFLSSRKNEQVYSSQTWRLVPVKECSLLFANLFSAVIDGIFLVLLQGAMIILAGLPAITTNEFWKALFENFGSIGEGKLWQEAHLTDLFCVFLLIILIAVFTYLTISSINFTGKIVSDFLPEKISKIVYFLVVVSLTCVGLIFLINVYWFVLSSLTGFLQNGMFLTTLSKDAVEVKSNLSSNYLTMLAIFIVDLILIAINIGLLNKYHEAKI